MTGEVTLLGKVLPVGGIKEKVLAAIRQDIFKIIMPKACEKDLVDLPKHIRSKIDVTLVQSMDEVLEKALTKKLPFSGKRMRRKHSTPISSTVQ